MIIQQKQLSKTINHETIRKALASTPHDERQKSPTNTRDQGKNASCAQNKRPIVPLHAAASSSTKKRGCKHMQKTIEPCPIAMMHICAKELDAFL